MTAAVAAGEEEAAPDVEVAEAARGDAETVPNRAEFVTDGLGLEEGVGKLEPVPVFGVPQICTMGLQ
jgi:hypothetical protein